MSLLSLSPAFADDDGFVSLCVYASVCVCMLTKHLINQRTDRK